MGNDRLDEFYKRVWGHVEKEYRARRCWSERNLQALLFEGLRQDGCHVVVEPTWGNAKPDLVVVREERIADIFELKFSPHTGYRNEWDDINKLLGYIGKKGCPWTLDPKTGQWDESHCLQVKDDCRLHFVAVARRGAEEEWPGPDDGVSRWYGCTGDRFDDQWCIQFAK